MYTTVAATPLEVFVAYVIILSSCALMFPFVGLLLSAVGKGLSKWR